MTTDTERWAKGGPELPGHVTSAAAPTSVGPGAAQAELVQYTGHAGLALPDPRMGVLPAMSQANLLAMLDAISVKQLQ
jgi:hypothetical protein